MQVLHTSLAGDAGDLLEKDSAYVNRTLLRERVWPWGRSEALSPRFDRLRLYRPAPLELWGNARPLVSLDPIKTKRLGRGGLSLLKKSKREVVGGIWRHADGRGGAVACLGDSEVSLLSLLILILSLPLRPLPDAMPAYAR